MSTVGPMEAEEPGLVVSSSMKFPVKRQTKKKSSEEYQTHGYEVDLVGANSERLVLATVKSFFGSQGVLARDVCGEGRGAGLYRLLNDPVIRDDVIAVACDRFGYRPEQVFLRFYVGRFSGKSEAAVRSAYSGVSVHSVRSFRTRLGGIEGRVAADAVVRSGPLSSPPSRSS
jgi:hypothetical protein